MTTSYKFLRTKMLLIYFFFKANTDRKKNIADLDTLIKSDLEMFI